MLVHMHKRKHQCIKILQISTESVYIIPQHIWKWVEHYIQMKKRLTILVIFIVPNIKINYQERMLEGEVFAIETFPTTGNGTIYELKDCNHYMIEPKDFKNVQTIRFFYTFSSCNFFLCLCISMVRRATWRRSFHCGMGTLNIMFWYLL